MAHHSPVVAVPSQTGTDYHFSALGRTNIMLAELVDHVIGVDPDKDWITTAIVDTKTTGVVDTARFSANSAGYRDAILWAEQHTTPGERVWAIEGSASFGRGLAARLTSDDEWIVEFDWAREKASKDGGKSDELDAIQAAREVLGRDTLNVPRTHDGHREALTSCTPSLAPARSEPAPLRSTNSKHLSSPLPTTCAPSFEG